MTSLLSTSDVYVSIPETDERKLKLLMFELRRQHNIKELTGRLHLKLLDLNFPRPINEMLHWPKLTHLNLSSACISDEEACCIFQCLQSKHYVSRLEYEQCII